MDGCIWQMLAEEIFNLILYLNILFWSKKIIII